MYVVTFICLYILTCYFYRKISLGLSSKEKFLRACRFIPCAAFAVLPSALANIPFTSGIYLTSFLVGLSWITTYPTLYYLTNKEISNEFHFHLDMVFGLYAIAWLTSLKILVLYFNMIPAFFMTVISIIEFIMLLLPCIQYFYYYLYGTCIDSNGMILILQTDPYETIEFIKSLPNKFLATVVFITVLIFCSILIINLNSSLEVPLANLSLLIIAGTAIFLTLYLYFWKRKTSRKYSLCVFLRTGIIKLYFDIKGYLETSALYTKNMEERIGDLSVTPQNTVFDKPSTIILIIGESASRDYMSAFVDYTCDTTPWLRSKKNSENFILFSHSYSCATYTLASLEKALTESNQYNDKQFYASISVIDIARKAGYKTHWYSNQEHIGGSSDTPVTLVAHTADIAQWTEQSIIKIPYDDVLLEYLKEIDTQQNNFIVIHLQGSHVNYMNRYPKEFTKWGNPRKYDLISNYLNSIAYTDFVIEKIYDFAIRKLNLQALVYFSDHAAIPDNRRSPNFGGFGEVRIPMFVYFSDEYIDKNKEIYETLKLHRNCYFTNDLIYDLMCSILNIRSNHFDEANSLASLKYRHTRETLKTDKGRLFIKDDPTDD